MDIQPRTEHENLLRHDVEGGAYRSVEHALSLLHAQQTWVAEDRAESNVNTLSIGRNPFGL
jgi:hypothetical protein